MEDMATTVSLFDMLGTTNVSGFGISLEFGIFI